MDRLDVRGAVTGRDLDAVIGWIADSAGLGSVSVTMGQPIGVVRREDHGCDVRDVPPGRGGTGPCCLVVQHPGESADPDHRDVPGGVVDVPHGVGSVGADHHHRPGLGSRFRFDFLREVGGDVPGVDPGVRVHLGRFLVVQVDQQVVAGNGDVTAAVGV